MRELNEASSARPQATSGPARKDVHESGHRAIEPRSQMVTITRAVAAEVFGPPADRDFDVRYWDAAFEAGGARSPRFTIVLEHPAALRGMLLPPSELRIAEAYVYGDIDVTGNLEAAATIADRVRARLRPARAARILRLLMALPRPPRHGDHTRPLGAARLGRRHSRSRDRAAIRSHYDVGNDFYALFLDEELVYSCGYFQTGSEDIHAAQRAKLELLCRKLRLREGEHLLDVGCGWGALIRHATSRHGVHAHGITLSTQQAEYATQRAAAEGLEGRCTVAICDYRELPPECRFDKVVSVGMFEHVGRRRQRTYFERMFAVTRPGGLFLNHGIVEHPRGSQSLGARAASRLWGEGEFIDRYVFPDGELVSLDEVIAAGERAGFETRDVESLREHYATTLRHWVERLEGAEPLATRLAGAATYRIWRLYMSASAHAFATGRLNLAQVLFAKPDARGRASVPRTRADLYA